MKNLTTNVIRFDTLSNSLMYAGKVSEPTFQVWNKDETKFIFEGMLSECMEIANNYTLGYITKGFMPKNDDMFAFLGSDTKYCKPYKHDAISPSNNSSFQAASAKMECNAEGIRNYITDKFPTLKCVD